MRNKPIPESAEFDDPLWTSSFLDLANSMIVLGARPKLIGRYTGLSIRAIRERYRRLVGKEAPGGRLQQTQTKAFSTPNSRGGHDWLVQAAAFAGVFLKIESAMNDEPVNRGWLLVTAYATYRRLTDPMLESTPKLNRLSLNTAYEIMTYLGYGSNRKFAPLSLQRCAVCGTGRLVVTEIETDSQSCPMCSINKRYVHLLNNVERNAAQKRLSAA